MSYDDRVRMWGAVNLGAIGARGPRGDLERVGAGMCKQPVDVRMRQIRLLDSGAGRIQSEGLVGQY